MFIHSLKVIQCIQKIPFSTTDQTVHIYIHYKHKTLKNYSRGLFLMIVTFPLKQTEVTKFSLVTVFSDETCDLICLTGVI